MAFFEEQRQESETGRGLYFHLREHRVFSLAVVTAGVWFFLRFLIPVFSPIFLAMIFVTMFGPLLLKMQKRFHIHRQIGALLLLFFAVVIFVLLGWLLFSWLIGSLPRLVDWLREGEQNLREWIGQLSALAENTLQVDGEYLEKGLSDRVEKAVIYFSEEFLPGIFSGSFRYLKNIAALAFFLLTFVIATVYLAKDYDRIMNDLLDRPEYHGLLQVVCGVIRYLAVYVKAQLIIMACICALTACVMGIAGIYQGVLWGILAGVLDALPFVGTGVVLLPLGLSFLTQKEYGKVFLCLGLYGGCVLLRELLEPKLIGKRLGVSPVAVILSIYAGIRLFGAWGLLKGPLGFVIIFEICKRLFEPAGNP